MVTIDNYNLDNLNIGDKVHFMFNGKVSTDYCYVTTCICCGNKTLDLHNNICDYCSWEDDGTINPDEYSSCNDGTMKDYRNRYDYMIRKFNKIVSE